MLIPPYNKNEEGLRYFDMKFRTKRNYTGFYTVEESKINYKHTTNMKDKDLKIFLANEK